VTLDVSSRIVGVPDQDLAAAVAQPGGVARLADRIARSGAVAVVIGADRFDPGRGRGHRVDPTSAALALGRALPELGLIVATAPTREHPYNVARRVLSLDHVLDGRVGLLVGTRDHGAPTAARTHDAAEFAEVVRGLWRTWPLDSIVGDRDAGLFVHAERIRPLDHDGGPEGYRVRGPLTTPSSRQGEPVLAVWHDVPAADADLVLGGDDHPLATLAPAPARSDTEATDAVDVARPGAASDPRGPHRASRPTLRDLLDLPVRAAAATGMPA